VWAVKIALDAMGGDYAPGEIIKGAVEAVQQPGTEVILVGKMSQIKSELKGYCFPSEAITVVHVSEEIGMNEHPAAAVRHKKDSSLVVATRMVKEGQASAVVSAGSTGAQMAAALFGLGRLEGIERPAIATVLPSPKGPKVLVDSGANVDTKPQHLVQFALLGSVYASQVLKIATPRVALINIGAEPNKGNQLVVESYQLLSQERRINFAGNVEGRDILTADIDVLVCDGFVGNIILKLAEGLMLTMTEMIKEELNKNPVRMVGGLLIKSGMHELARKLDYSEYGGAPLLGVRGISMICHGSSKAKSIKNAIRIARESVESNFLEKMLAQLKVTV
jgi:glycerol-3-phosphate acyltransferase PlsX